MAATVVQTVGSAALVVSLMFAAGLRLRWAELVALRERSRIVVLALLVNLALVPATTRGLIAVFALPVEIALGLLLVAAAPGGPAAVLYTNTARADLALTVGLTIVLPIIGVVTTPLTLALIPGLPNDLAIPALPMIASLIGFQLVPLALGMMIRARTPQRADRLAPIAAHVANAVLVLLVVTMLFLAGHVLTQIDGPTWIAMIGTAVVALAIGYLAALPGQAGARSGAIVAISRNISVAIMLSSTFVRDAVVDATVLSFGLVAFLGPLVLALIWRRSTPATA